MRKPDAPALVMSREDHANYLVSYWRQREADRMTDDLLFDEQLRAVAFAMAEPEPRPIDKAVVGIFSGYIAFIGFGGYLLLQMMRP